MRARTREGTSRIAEGRQQRPREATRPGERANPQLKGGASCVNPLAEFLAADDYAETNELVAVIRGSDGGRKMYGPAANLPPAYGQFCIATYRDRVQATGSWNKLAVVVAESDSDAILNHALTQARRRGDLLPQPFDANELPAAGVNRSRLGGSSQG